MAFLEKQSDEMEEMRQVISQYEYCVKHFKPLLERLNEYKQLSQTKLSSLKAEMERLETCTANLEKQTNTFSEIENQYAGIRNLDNGNNYPLVDLCVVHDYLAYLNKLDGPIANAAARWCHLKQYDEHLVKMHIYYSHIALT